MRYLLNIILLVISTSAFSQELDYSRWSRFLYASLPDGSVGLELKKKLGKHSIELYLKGSLGYTPYVIYNPHPVISHVMDFNLNRDLWPSISYGIRYYWPAQVFNKKLKPFIAVSQSSGYRPNDFYIGGGGIYTFNNRFALIVASHYGFLIGRRNVFLNGLNKGIRIFQYPTIGLRYYYWQRKKGPKINEY